MPNSSEIRNLLGCSSLEMSGSITATFQRTFFSAVPCSPALVVHEECVGGFCLSAALWGLPAPAKSPAHDVLMMKLPEMARCCRRGPGLRDEAEVPPHGNWVHAD